MKIVVCIGSSCHLKGSRQVVEDLQNLIASSNLKDEINLSGTFCMGNCQKGVCVTVDGTDYSLTPSNTNKFFNDFILTQFN
ncbi:MAG: NAD(P)H-dependent oxidoreductase subunit E [Tenericutes bacterium]|nr:NAD(P)H-dependent oxidoreductase subunit E [Mycoplasmatota bacterium]